MEVTNAASVTIQVHLITESTVLSNLLQWPLKTNKETSDIKTQPYGISFTKSVCDLSALKSASYSLRDLTFLPALGRKGWWMSRVRQALYGEWVNRLRGASAALHYGPLPLLQPQKLLNNVLRKPQQWLIVHRERGE